MNLVKSITVVGIIFLIVASPLSYAISFTNFCTINEFVSGTPVVLVTGFGPFDIYDINPSQLIAETLDGQNIDGAEIIGIVLPVDFDESVEVVTKAIINYSPMLVISVGLAPRAHKINVEKCGINLKILSRNESWWFIPRRIEPCGHFIRLSPIHTRGVVRELREAGIPSRQSYYAGMYVCNAVLYGTLGFIKDHKLPTKSGFVHVPLLSSQNPDGMDLETMVDAVELVIKTSLK